MTETDDSAQDFVWGGDDTGFAVYSTDSRPQRLHSRGNADGIDVASVEAMVRFGDRPLDLYADLASGQLVWSFKGDRHTKSARTGYFLAAYRGTEDLFRGFESELRQLHETDGWAIEYEGEPRWDIGFDLSRVPEELPESTQFTTESLADRVRERTTDAPLEFGMRTHGSAVQVIRALADHGLDCTVAIGTGGDATALTDVDLLLRPGAASDFEPRVEGVSESEADEQRDGDSPIPPQASQRRMNVGTFATRVAGALALVCLGLAAFSFVSPSVVQPITGLATLGGITGAAAGLTIMGLLTNSDASADPLNQVREFVLSHPDRTLLVVGYGTVLGFLFPRVMWETGRLLGLGGYPFGPVTTVPNVVPSVALYVSAVFAANVAFVTVRRELSERETERNVNTLFGTAVAAHAAYALCLVITTGFAGALWFRLIPSATV